MDMWYVDIIGPISVYDDKMKKKRRIESNTGSRYFLDIVDIYSRVTIGTDLNYKSDATFVLIRIIRNMQVKTGNQLVNIHMDQSSELLSKEFRYFLNKNGTTLHTTTPYSPVLNNYIERNNGVLSNGTTCLIMQAKASQLLWPYAMSYLVYVKNRLPHGTINYQLPILKFLPNEIVNLDKVKIWGCDAFPLEQKFKRGKFQSKTLHAAFIGYSYETHEYKLMLLDTLKIIKSRDVKFIENSFNNIREISIKLDERDLKSEDSVDDRFEVDYIDDVRETDGVTEYQIFWKGYDIPTWEPEENLDDCEWALELFRRRREGIDSNDIYYEIALSTKEIKEQTMYKSAINYKIPQNIKEVENHVDSNYWLEAIDKEVESLRSNNVFEEWNKPLPPNAKVLGSRYTFTIKHNNKNEIVRYKGRLVAKGFGQRDGIDYYDTFSPTVKYKTIRQILAIAAIFDLEIDQLDFDTAFLNAELKEEIFIETPYRYPSSSKYVKLRRALYGLKQASREWNKTIHSYLTSIGYINSVLDECLYYKLLEDGSRIYLLLYVDDLIPVYPKKYDMVWFNDKNLLSTKFKIKDLGECRWILNVELIRHRDKKLILLSQQGTIDKILHEHGMEHAKIANTPYWVTHIEDGGNKIDSYYLNPVEHNIYRSLVGELLFLAIFTRPDISFIVSLLSRYQANPMNYHLIALKYILRYLNGSKSKCLLLGNINKSDNIVIDIYTDASWADLKDDRKSTSGCISLLNGSAIFWLSKKQSTVALSSTESEIYAFVEGVKEAIYYKSWFNIYHNKSVPQTIFVDNQGLMEIVDHTTNHQKTKHIEIKYFFIRDKYHEGIFNLTYISSRNNIADILTKATTLQIFKSHVDKLMN